MASGVPALSRLEELLRRIRDGDEAAAVEFVHTYEPHVRRVIRARIRVARMRRVSDSSDLCQVVLASFLVQAAVGQYEPADSDEMRKLLGRIARNKVADLVVQARVPRSSCAGRGCRRERGRAGRAGLGPASQLALSELIQKAEQLLTDSERPIAELRKQGLTWDEVGHRLNKSADAARKTLDRAARRIMLALGLEERNDE